MSLAVNQLIGFGASNYETKTLLKIIQDLGLTSGLQVVLDAGDSASYSGTGQTWTDVQSGANYYRGTTSGSDTTDPTFNGVAGGLSPNEYWSFDGGDYFTPVAATTFDDGYHKNGATWSFLAIYYLGTTATNLLFSNTNSAANTGIQINANTALDVTSRNGSTNQTDTIGSHSATTWYCTGVSVSENGGASGGNWNMNGTTGTFDPALTSPSASNPSASLNIGASSTGANIMTNNSRLMGLCFWNTNLSAADLAALYADVRAYRFNGQTI